MYKYTVNGSQSKTIFKKICRVTLPTLLCTMVRSIPGPSLTRYEVFSICFCNAIVVKNIVIILV